MQKNRLFLSVIALSLVLTGAGCQSVKDLFSRKSEPVSESALMEATRSVEFIPGDQLTIKQTLMGAGGLISQLASLKEGTRVVTITRFAPAHTASFTWDMSVEKETETSIQARKDYEIALKAGTSTGLPPVPVFETIVTTGTVNGISLSTAHTGFFPSYWEPKTLDLVGEKSAIWLSDDAFQELQRTGKTTFNMGVFDEVFAKLTKGFTDVKDAVNALQQQADKAASANQDLTLLQVDDTVKEYTIRVNGEKKVVSVLKARNWFGEIIVLNNQQNPLILKATLNPFKSGVADAFSGWDAFYNKFFGYEITDFTIKR